MTDNAVQPTQDKPDAFAVFTNDPSPEQLEAYFTLEPRDLELIATCRYPHTKLGLALQLGTLKFLGTFSTEFAGVPRSVLEYLAAQLGVRDVNLKRYAGSLKTRLEHQALILSHLDYRRFEGAAVLRVIRRLFTKLLISNETTELLFDLVTRDLVDHRVVLPGATTISRLIARVRERANVRLYTDLAQRLSKRQTSKLDALLVRERGETRTGLERLRAAPIDATTVTLAAALKRLELIREVGVGKVKLDDVAENRLAPMVRLALTVRAADLEKHSRPRRRATLLALLQHLERSATDDVLTIFARVMDELDVRGRKRRQVERLRSLKDLDAAALTLRDVARVILDSSIPAALVRATILERLGEPKLFEAITQVTNLASPAGSEEAEVWETAHRSVALFIVPLLSALRFEGGPGAKNLLEAMAFVQRSSGTARSSWGDPPKAFVPQSWTRMIFPDGDLARFKRPHYVVCVAHQLHAALKRRDIFVSRSHRNGDPRAQLIAGEDWAKVKTELLSSLDLDAKPEVMIAQWSRGLNAAYKTVAANLESNPSVSVKRDGDAVSLTITPLEALPVSPSLVALNAGIEARLPEIDLTELLLEINARTGFAAELISAADSHAYAPEIETTVIAVLIAEACNIGLKAVAQEQHRALTLSRLDRVKRSLVTAATITAANVKLVEYQSTLALAQRWGGGAVASADGLRFKVPVRSIDSGFNRKYFGAQRGITYYTLVSDQHTMLHGQVVHGTLRDSLVILAGLLEQPTTLQPVEIMTDTAAYSDVVFGLFFLLGYRFSPRLADAGSARYWRIDTEAKYGDLNDVARHRINTALIAQHWEDVLRLIASLKLGKLRALDAMRVLSRDGELGGLGRAVQEIGRIAKTLFLLEYLDDPSYRRRILAALNAGETRNDLSRATAHGGKGEIKKHYKAGMESQLGALGFVVNTIVLWNTLYMGASLALLEAMGDDVLPEDVARLSPLKWRHINMLGRYDFSISPDVAGGDLRPLRDPNADVGLEE